MSEEEHRCSGLRLSEDCIDGRVYGYCSSEYNCNGACEQLRGCDCECHE